MITIGNKGQDIANTNYWDTEAALNGYFYLSFNAGAARLLVPDNKISEITEMKTGKYVIISRGPCQHRNYDWENAYELLFEDFSNCPYSLTTSNTDRWLPVDDAGKDLVFTVWTKSGNQLELPAKYRIVKQLPDLSGWGDYK